MNYNYIIETEKILIEGIEKNNSIFFKHTIPKLYKKTNCELHRGLNQLKLAQMNFTEYSISSAELLKDFNILSISGKPILICEKSLTEKKVYYYFFFRYFKKKDGRTWKTKTKIIYDFSNIEDILEYYFSCCINGDPYCPRFNQIQKNNLLNFIKNHPYDFSKLTNETFNKLIRGK